MVFVVVNPVELKLHSRDKQISFKAQIRRNDGFAGVFRVQQSKWPPKFSSRSSRALQRQRKSSLSSELLPNCTILAIWSLDCIMLPELSLHDSVDGSQGL